MIFELLAAHNSIDWMMSQDLRLLTGVFPNDSKDRYKKRVSCERNNSNLKLLTVS